MGLLGIDIGHVSHFRWKCQRENTTLLKQGMKSWGKWDNVQCITCNVPDRISHTVLLSSHTQWVSECAVMCGTGPDMPHIQWKNLSKSSSWSNNSLFLSYSKHRGNASICDDCPKPQSIILGFQVYICYINGVGVHWFADHLALLMYQPMKMTAKSHCGEYFLFHLCVPEKQKKKQSHTS